MLKSDAETLEDIRIVIVLLERAYYRECNVVGGESPVTKQIDESIESMNEIVEMLEGE
ncbi:hypothetical protein [Enterococcus dongliensis]|uniref:Uncharacterized protein n=1 Tax=Enterococcus dongliensis TaxID=2559925 RepID=A0AAW8TLJ1_9ENTE|nr:hypothetical protein [Enterococcus dongliensis]MDT2637962.1 hypothetical protein [Enterococcus dongliensis]